MSQDVFCSLYTKDYKWWENVDRPPLAKGINIAEDPEKYDKFLSPCELKPDNDSVEAIRYLHRLWCNTTYRIDFCEGSSARSKAPADPLKEDELMDSIERALNPSVRKLLPPPDTSRVAYGFCPVRRFRSGRTFYTDVHSRPAYQRLIKFVQDRGMCRLAAPPAQYPEPDYSTPPCRQGREPSKPSWIHLCPNPSSC